MFEYKYALTKEEYLEFNNFYALTSEEGKRTVKTIRLAGPIALIAMIILLWAVGLNIGAIACGFIAGLIVCFFTIKNAEKSLLKNIAKTIDRMEKDGSAPYDKGEVTVSFDDNEISEQSETSELKIKYAKVQRVCVTDSAIYVFFSAMEAFILPNRIFSSEEEKKDLLDFIEAKI